MHLYVKYHKNLPKSRPGWNWITFIKHFLHFIWFSGGSLLLWATCLNIYDILWSLRKSWHCLNDLCMILTFAFVCGMPWGPATVRAGVKLDNFYEEAIVFLKKCIPFYTNNIQLKNWPSGLGPTRYDFNREQWGRKALGTCKNMDI